MAVAMGRVPSVSFGAETICKLPCGDLAFLLCVLRAGGVPQEHLV